MRSNHTDISNLKYIRSNVTLYKTLNQDYECNKCRDMVLVAKELHGKTRLYGLVCCNSNRELQERNQ